MKSFYVAAVLATSLCPLLSSAATHNLQTGHAKTKPAIHRMHRTHKPHQTSVAKVDLNQADATEIATLVGIGPKKAAQIIAYRSKHGSFKTLNDLTHIHGIGPKSIIRLRKQNQGRLLLTPASK